MNTVLKKTHERLGQHEHQHLPSGRQEKQVLPFPQCHSRRLTAAKAIAVPPPALLGGTRDESLHIVL